MTPRDQEGAREIWLRCPSCQWTWRVMISSPLLTAAEIGTMRLTAEPCNICDTTEPMQVVDGPERRRKK